MWNSVCPPSVLIWHYIGYRRVSVARCFEVRLTSYVGPGGPIRAGVLKVRRSYGIEGYRCF